MPKTTVKYSPMVAPGDNDWKRAKFCQEAFTEISKRIEARPHVKFDPWRPERKGWLDRRDLIHLKDWESITHWRKMFDQL